MRVFFVDSLHVVRVSLIWMMDIQTFNCILWQRSNSDIYPAREIIFTCYYSRNETETVVSDQLKQASNDYYPSRTHRINECRFINPDLQAKCSSLLRPLPRVTIADFWCILQLFDLRG